MAADFWAGYISGAIGILIGNPLDLIKVRLQAGTLKPSANASTSRPTSPISPDASHSVGSEVVSNTSRLYKPPSISSLASASTSATVTIATRTRSYVSQFSTLTSLLRGSSAPILGYGALNALLFMTYNRSASYLTYGTLTPPTNSSTSVEARQPSLFTTFIAGALGGLATWVVSTPTELVKCRAQATSPGHVSNTTPANTSFQIARQIFQSHGVKGLYTGGIVTSLRDSIGYGFYFWSYEASTRFVSSYFHTNDKDGQIVSSGKEEAIKTLLCGGLAGVVTWASVFPLDVIKTRVQTQSNLFTSPRAASALPVPNAQTTLLGNDGVNVIEGMVPKRPLGAMEFTRQAYRNEGAAVFFRGLGVCSVRAFVVNAVQWAVYEWVMNELVPGRRKST